MHRTSGPESEALRVGDLAIWIHSDEPVRNCDLVKEASLSVQECRVWLPDLGEKLPVQGKLRKSTEKI